MRHEMPNNPFEDMNNMESPFEDFDNLDVDQTYPNLLKELEDKMSLAVKYGEYQKAVHLCGKLVELEDALKVDPIKIEKRKKEKEEILERVEQAIDDRKESSHLHTSGCESGKNPPCGRKKIDPVACSMCEKNISVNKRNIGGRMPKSRLPKGVV